MLRLALFLTSMAVVAGLVHGRVHAILPQIPLAAQTAFFCLLVGLGVAAFLRIWDAHSQKKIRASIDRLEQAKAALEELAHTDSLTGVLNRRGFEREYRRIIRHTKRCHSHLCLALVDVDGLKRINDSLGHREGDRALKLVAKCLCATLRSSDVVARIGGDEFAVILPNASSDTGRAAMERFKKELASQHSKPGEPRFGVSVGVACTQDGFEGLFERADSDMYFAKPRSLESSAAVELPARSSDTEPTEAA